MTKYGLVLFGSILINLCTVGLASALPTEAVVRELANSVLRVEVKLADGRHGLGSAVVIAQDELITNCHVVNGATQIAVVQNGQALTVTSIKPDWRHDLCMLKVERLNAPAVRLGSTENLKYETSVFTVGYPDGITSPVSTYGVVKGMFPMDGSVVMRATSSFRLGASGGGAFDDAGNLVGIITLKSRGTQAYYYYMPVEWVQALMQKHAEPIGIKGENPFWASADKPYFMRVVQPYLSQDWKSLLSIARQWTVTEPSVAESWFYLGAAELATKDYASAEVHFRQVLSMNKDHRQAADYLAEITSKLAKRTDARQLALLD